jgi:hypothetical protein
MNIFLEFARRGRISTHLRRLTLKDQRRQPREGRQGKARPSGSIHRHSAWYINY